MRVRGDLVGTKLILQLKTTPTLWHIISNTNEICDQHGGYKVHISKYSGEGKTMLIMCKWDQKPLEKLLP